MLHSMAVTFTTYNYMLMKTLHYNHKHGLIKVMNMSNECPQIGNVHDSKILLSYVSPSNKWLCTTKKPGDTTK